MTKRKQDHHDPFVALRNAWEYPAAPPYRPEDRVYVMNSVGADPRFTTLYTAGGDMPLRRFAELARKHPDRVGNMAKRWVAPHVTGRVSNWNDCPMVWGCFPAFSERAVEALRDLLIANGVLLPLRSMGKRYYAFIARPVKNILDLKRSVIEWETVRGARQAVHIDRHEFRTELLPGHPIFGVYGQPERTYVTRAFVERVKESDLIGFNFEIVFPLREKDNWNTIALRNLRRHLREGTSSGQAVAGKRSFIHFLLDNPNRIPTPREEKQIKTWATMVDGRLHDPDSMEPPIGYVSRAVPDTGECTVILKGSDPAKYLAKVKPLIPRARWPGKVRIAGSGRINYPSD
jgi:hypothetical protein